MVCPVLVVMLEGGEREGRICCGLLRGNRGACKVMVMVTTVAAAKDNSSPNAEAVARTPNAKRRLF